MYFYDIDRNSHNFLFHLDQGSEYARYYDESGKLIGEGPGDSDIFNDYYAFSFDTKAGLAHNTLHFDNSESYSTITDVYDGANETAGLNILATGYSNLVIGGSGADRIEARGSGVGIGNEIWAGAGDDTIYLRVGSEAHGEDGKDRIVGSSGNDYIFGEGGQDILTGGSGRDTYVFDRSGSRDIDHITSFSVKDDGIALQNTAFSGMGAKVDAGEFKDITDPHTKLDANDHILYNHDTGRVYYDHDGSGPSAKQQFAILDNHPTLTHASFGLFH